MVVSMGLEKVCFCLLEGRDYLLAPSYEQLKRKRLKIGVGWGKYLRSRKGWDPERMIGL